MSALMTSALAEKDLPSGEKLRDSLEAIVSATATRQSGAFSDTLECEIDYDRLDHLIEQFMLYREPL